MAKKFLEFVEEILEKENYLFESIIQEQEEDTEEDEEIEETEDGSLYVDEDEAEELGIDLDEVPEEGEEEEVEEAIKKKKVVRGGKRQIKFYTDKPGFKIVMKNGKPVEVKMSAQEIKSRKKAALKSAKKKKGKMQQILKKRAKSMAKK